MIGHADFARRICETPYDDLPRKAYADYLQENGEDARAEFIRLALDLATKPCPAFMYSCYEYQTQCSCPDVRWDQLAELLGVGAFQWVPPATGNYVSWAPRCDATEETAFARGFVRRVELWGNWEDFEDEAVFAESPIEAVHFPSLAPWQPRPGHGRYLWLNAGVLSRTTMPQAEVPAELFSAMRANGCSIADRGLSVRFDSERDARKALSDAAVDVGRKAAGLPAIVRPTPRMSP